MFKIQIHRNLLAIATVATLWSLPVMLQAAELHPMVVVGIPADSVALRHPTPEYPRNALNLHISGNVVVTVRVENGKIMELRPILIRRLSWPIPRPAGWPTNGSSNPP